jgi:hypothetical protein
MAGSHRTNLAKYVARVADDAADFGHVAPQKSPQNIGNSATQLAAALPD